MGSSQLSKNKTVGRTQARAKGHRLAERWVTQRNRSGVRFAFITCQDCNCAINTWSDSDYINTQLFDHTCDELQEMYRTA